MDLPPSSLLSRLQSFLPEMEKANQATARLAQEGKLDVLDANLEVSPTDQQREDEGGEETDNEEEEDEMHGDSGEEKDAEEHAEEGGSGGEGVIGERIDGRTVQLDFALGDFDDTPIAQMERAKEDGAEAGGGAGTTSRTSQRQEDGIVEEEGDGRIAALVRVDGEKKKAGAKRQEAPRKPLIEEL